MTTIDHDELKLLLIKIGMKAYVEILFPAIMKDQDISVAELCQTYPEFNKYTNKAQNTRRAKARKIFKNGWQFAALDAVIMSSKTALDVRTKAQALKSQYRE